MSHVITIKAEFRDLEAVRAACKRMGWELVKQATYAWYGRFMDDYNGEDRATDTLVAREDLGKCDYAIKVPGARYEIGLIERDGKLIPVWDYFCSGGLGHVKAENGMAGFVQAYSIEKAKIEAKKKGMQVSEQTLADGSVKLTVKGGYS